MYWLVLLFDKSDHLNLARVQRRRVRPALLHLIVLSCSLDRAQFASQGSSASATSGRASAVPVRAGVDELGEEAVEECFHGWKASTYDPDIKLDASPVCCGPIVPRYIGGDRDLVE